MNAAVEDDGISGEKAAALDPAVGHQPPPRTGACTTSSNNNSTGYDYAPQRGGTPGGYGGGVMPSGYGYNDNSNGNNNWGGDPYGQPPPTTGMVSLQQQQHYGAGPPRQLSSASSSMGSSRSWGSQPPLTSSKRDQNWERKRRQWLARKNGSMGSAGFSGGGRLRSAGPPGSSSYGSNMGGGMAMNPWEDQSNANAPPSPLSKFVHQQSQKQQQGGGFGGYDYERVGTAQSQAPFSLPQPPATAAAYTRGADMYTSSGYALPPTSSSGGSIGAQGRMSHFNSAPPHQAASEFGYGGNATPASRDGPAVAGVSTSSGGNTGNRNVSSAATRQPPGGHSNWSPFS